jgi:hypothetical protein
MKTGNTSKAHDFAHSTGPPSRWKEIGIRAPLMWCFPHAPDVCEKSGNFEIGPLRRDFSFVMGKISL